MILLSFFTWQKPLNSFIFNVCNTARSYVRKMNKAMNDSSSHIIFPFLISFIFHGERVTCFFSALGNQSRCVHPSPTYLWSTAGLRWPWPPAGPVPAGPGSAGIVPVCRWTICVSVCLPSLIIWIVQMSEWPGSPSGGATGDQTAPSHSEWWAAARRPASGREGTAAVVSIVCMLTSHTSILEGRRRT